MVGTLAAAVGVYSLRLGVNAASGSRDDHHWRRDMLRQLNLLTLPTAISVASFDATFFVIANIFGLTRGEILLGLVAGAAGGLSVLAAVLWQSARNVATQVTK